jgi:hypothetical protein
MQQAGRRTVLDANDSSPPDRVYNSTTMIPLAIIGANHVETIAPLGTSC